MTSINQNRVCLALPNFRNLGVMLRILLIVNGASLLAAVVRTQTWQAAGNEFMAIATIVEPILLLSLVVLYAAQSSLERLSSYAAGIAAVLSIELGLATGVYFFGERVARLEDTASLGRYWLFSLAAAGALLAYFNLRSRALSPAIAESRLQALQARIRPHFLFNSINAVLSLIRSDPKRAEQALEDMAHLFRVLMADNRQLSTLKDEVELCRQYLQLEQLRLGDRLQVEWHVDHMPEDALIPPLVLQPLLENAVYHGIEPASDPGVIGINIYKSRDEVHAVLRNPYSRQGSNHAGNKMALANIRERLSLHFDVEARLETQITGDTYQVHITLPYQAGKQP